MKKIFLSLLIGGLQSLFQFRDTIRRKASLTSGMFSLWLNCKGVAWDFINLTLNLSYDAVTGMTYGVELGAIINIGGTRTIGSMIERKNKKD